MTKKIKSSGPSEKREIPLVLSLSRNQHHHYAPLKGCADFTILETPDWNATVVRENDPDLLLTLCSDWYEANECILEARRLKIPSLYMMDGILEWRHQWENPEFGLGGGIPYNQPVTTDKIACLGWKSIRTLEYWGNVGKCELVGMPRFDQYLVNPSQRAAKDGAKRLLIMTANTPGFTNEQVSLVKNALVDVREYLQTQKTWVPVWRVRKGLDVELNLIDAFPELQNKPLYEVLKEVDAVLTTPSTVILEAMLAGIPTAVLDYSNSPNYVPSAWMITAPSQIESVLVDMSDPKASKMVFQDEILHDCLECFSPATPRLVLLINGMINIGIKARNSKGDISFPGRILPIDFGGYALPSEYFDFSKLYPEHPVFMNHDLTELQLELIHAKKEIEDLRRQLNKSKKKGILATSLRKISGRDW